MNLVGKTLLGFKDETALTKVAASGRDLIVNWGVAGYFLLHCERVPWYTAHTSLKLTSFCICLPGAGVSSV